MARTQKHRLPFPSKGIHKGAPYTRTPRRASPAAQNVRTFMEVSGRATGGQRPGLSRGYSQRLGSVQAARGLLEGFESDLSHYDIDSQSHSIKTDNVSEGSQSLGYDRTDYIHDDLVWLGEVDDKPLTRPGYEYAFDIWAPTDESWAVQFWFAQQEPISTGYYLWLLHGDTADNYATETDEVSLYKRNGFSGGEAMDVLHFTGSDALGLGDGAWHTVRLQWRRTEDRGYNDFAILIDGTERLTAQDDGATDWGSSTGPIWGAGGIGWQMGYSKNHRIDGFHETVALSSPSTSPGPVQMLESVKVEESGYKGEKRYTFRGSSGHPPAPFRAFSKPKYLHWSENATPDNPIPSTSDLQEGYWREAPLIARNDALAVEAAEEGTTGDASDVERSALLPKLDVDDSEGYSVKVTAHAEYDNGTKWAPFKDHTVFFYLGLDDSYPDPLDNGITVAIHIKGGEWSGGVPRSETERRLKDYPWLQTPHVDLEWMQSATKYDIYKDVTVEKWYGGDADVTIEAWEYTDGSVTRYRDEEDFDEYEETTTGAYPDEAVVAVSGQTISVVVNGKTLAQFTASATPATDDIGIGAQNDARDGESGLPKLEGEAWVYLEELEVRGVWVGSEDDPSRTRLLASAEGRMWEEAERGKMSRITGTMGEMPASETLAAVEHSQRVFFPCYGQVRCENSNDYGSISGTNNNELSDSSGLDFANQGIDTETDVVVLYDPADPDNGPTPGTYEIQGVTSTAITLKGDADNTGDVAYTVEKAPRMWSEPSGMGLWTANGESSVPNRCTMAANYRGRIVLSGDPQNPENWWMSRQGDPFDWDFAETDAQAAVAGDLSEAGVLGEDITALVPLTDDYMLFGCVSSLWLLRGDPMRPGGRSLDPISHNVGIVGPDAWCHGRGRSVYFLGTDGMYKLSGTDDLSDISTQRIPELPGDFELSNYHAHVAWNNQEYGVHVWLTEKGGGRCHTWFYDSRYDAWWPDSIPEGAAPHAAAWYDADTAGRKRLVMGGRDGYIREWDEHSAQDRATNGEVPVSSYVTWRPRRVCGQNDWTREGVIRQINLTLAERSAPVILRVHVGESHESALDGPPMHTTWLRKSGRQRTYRRRARGAVFTITLGNSRASEAWEYETGVVNAKWAGRQR